MSTEQKDDSSCFFLRANFYSVTCIQHLNFQFILPKRMIFFAKTYLSVRMEIQKTCEQSQCFILFYFLSQFMFTLYQIDFVPTRKAMRKIRNIYPICDSPLKGNVPQDDSQRRFLGQHRVATLFRMVATLFQHCFEWLQHCSNIAALCYAKIVVAYRPV